ncbi:hypothetical protein V475_13050 [Sphingobium baderi LL03]|nr:hypothetical protein V475_13050 [Sphingobium baderi LL03]
MIHESIDKCPSKPLSRLIIAFSIDVIIIAIDEI